METIKTICQNKKMLRLKFVSKLNTENYEVNLQSSKYCYLIKCKSLFSFHVTYFYTVFYFNTVAYSCDTFA